MTAEPPTEANPQPVPNHPPWAWFPGRDGMVHARREVSAHNFTALLAAIRKQEGDEGVAKVALDLERDGLEERFPHREVWWLAELGRGNSCRITWHSRVRGEMNADVHADTAVGLAAEIAGADAEREEAP